MARQVVGKAAFRYASTGATVETEVRLGTPLHDLELDESRTRLVAEALDKVNREIVTIGPVLDQVKGRVRFHAEPAELVDLKTVGLDGTKLRYVPNTAEPAFQYHVRLVDASPVTPDPQRAGRKEFQQQLTIRQWSSTAEQLDSLVYGRRLLFQYEPGRDLAQIGAVFSSTGGNTYTDSDGTTGQVAAANKARDAHYQTFDGEWTRTLRISDSTAAPETLYFPWPHRPQPMTIYAKWSERGMLNTANGSLFHLSDGAGAGPAFFAYRSAVNGRLDLFYKTSTGGTAESRMTIGATNGDGVEVVCQLSSAGQPQGYHSLNGGTVSKGTTVAGTGSLGSTWSAGRVWIAQRNGAIQGSLDLVDFKVASGIRSMAYMRGAP